MDPEQTFIRVQERFAQMLTPRIRATLEYLYLFMAVTLFCILVVMHANYVQQGSKKGVPFYLADSKEVILTNPGCSSELSRVNISDAQLIQIKITSAGLWSLQKSNQLQCSKCFNREPIGENMKHANEDSTVTAAKKPWLDWLSDGAKSVGSFRAIFISPKESLKAAIIRIGQICGRLSFIWRVSKRVLGGLWFRLLSSVHFGVLDCGRSLIELQISANDIAGIHLHIDIPKLLKTLHMDKLNSYAVA
ncbi:hypothetical protein HAX54_046551 [Datura stramonium]|uniref:Uncharacterized protein n=1 Tax=Datura stramonium TaxID=4076 RepID=A0ABS8WJI8_DATST|nr:hypothetical protein [Datura stramonium]